MDKPLTKSEIGSMLASGLPESTILLKIETAAYYGLVNLDASSAALAALKQRGASERVLNEVMWAEPFGAALKWQQEEDREDRAAPPPQLERGLLPSFFGLGRTAFVPGLASILLILDWEPGI